MHQQSLVIVGTESASPTGKLANWAEELKQLRFAYFGTIIAVGGSLAKAKNLIADLLKSSVKFCLRFRQSRSLPSAWLERKSKELGSLAIRLKMSSPASEPDPLGSFSCCPFRA